MQGFSNFLDALITLDTINQNGSLSCEFDKCRAFSKPAAQQEVGEKANHQIASWEDGGYYPCNAEFAHSYICLIRVG